MFEIQTTSSPSSKTKMIGKEEVINDFKLCCVSREASLLARKEVGIPVTSYAHSGNAAEGLISSVGSDPLIVKVLESTEGKGLLLTEKTKTAESLINAFLSLHADFLVQEFIAESAGADI